MAANPFTLYTPSYWADTICLAVVVTTPVWVFVWLEYFLLILGFCILAIFACPLLHGYSAQFDPVRGSITIARTWFYAFCSREVTVYAAGDIKSVAVTSPEGWDSITLEFRDGRTYSFSTRSAKKVYSRITAMRESAHTHAQAT